MRRLAFTVASISGSGYGLTSITSSRKRTARRTTRSSSAQSTAGASPSPVRASRATFIEPRLHASHGGSDCSPQGFVASIWVSSGVGFAELRLIRSMKIIPGSPVRHAAETMWSNTSGAASRPTGCPERGFTSS